MTIGLSPFLHMLPMLLGRSLGAHSEPVTELVPELELRTQSPVLFFKRGFLEAALLLVKSMPWKFDRPELEPQLYHLSAGRGGGGHSFLLNFNLCFCE